MKAVTGNGNFTVLDIRLISVQLKGSQQIVCCYYSELDYDFLFPDHMYEFTVTATDMDPVSPRSGSVTVQVRARDVSARLQTPAA